MRSVSRRGLALSTALAAVAGYVDAIGFLGTGGLFVSFMSGNSTQAAVGLVEGEFGFALFGLSLVGAFVLGVIAGALLNSLHARHPQSFILWMAAGAMLASTVWGLTPWASSWRFVVVAAAMGILNTLFLAEGRARIAVTYATGTLVSLGIGIADAMTGRGAGSAWRRPLLLWGALAVGGGVGALGVVMLGDLASLAAVVALAGLAVVVWWRYRPTVAGRRYRPTPRAKSE